ncbi:MAG: phosphatase PAP2 family protein [Ginsengibacter sp.]
MKFFTTVVIFCSLLSQQTQAQDSSFVMSAKQASPYKTSFKTDALITTGAVGLTALGVYLVQNKKDLTPAQLAARSKDDVNFFDRGSAGFYSEKANDDSYIPFYAAFASPLAIMLINKNERSKAGQVIVLYTQTLAITSAMFTVAAGSINRSRPLVYGTKAPESLRRAGKSQRSFYAGHTASTAAATFFAAQTFADFNPDSKLKPFIWVVAAAVPATVGYLRYKAGYHFLSDNILGYVIGAGTGILIPKWHRSGKMQNLTLSPFYENNLKGITFNYKF